MVLFDQLEVGGFELLLGEVEGKVKQLKVVWGCAEAASVCSVLQELAHDELVIINID